MPQFRQLPSFQNARGADFELMEEQASAARRRWHADPYRKNVISGQLADEAPASGKISAITTGSLKARRRAAGGQLIAMPGTTDEFAAISKSNTDQLDFPEAPAFDPDRPLPMPLPGAVHTSSLNGLLASMRPSTEPTTGTRMVVIHAERKRKKQAPVSENVVTKRLTPKQRHGIIMLLTVVLAALMLFSITPLGGGQNGFTILSNGLNWFQSQYSNLSLIPASNQQGVSTAPQLVNVNPANLPPMTIPNSPYVAVAQQDATNEGISPVYFVRQINQESGFNPNAVSPAGAVGIAQFLPSTAASLGIDPWNPVEALRGAAHLMASSANQYGGDYAKALAAYNAGPGAVNNAVASCGGAWLSCTPAETQHYVYIIMGV